jgi:phage gp36-like protein
MTLEGQYEYYRCVQHDFNEAYRAINKYVTELYMLPKKFVDNTGPALDRYIKNYYFPENSVSDNSNNSFSTVVDFINQLDDFTQGTIELFTEHKMHSDRSKAYMQRVSQLKEKNYGKIVSEYAVDYIELTPELTSLHKDLGKLKARADEMVNRLEKLELRWESIRVRIRA